MNRFDEVLKTLWRYRTSPDQLPDDFQLAHTLRNLEEAGQKFGSFLRTGHALVE